MPTQRSIPIGYMELANGSKPIYPMDDLFLNYTFERHEHWEALRSIINLIIRAYQQLHPNTKLKSIEGAIQVRTQFHQLMTMDEKEFFREQDFKVVTANSDATYIEFQNQAYPKKPISTRSIEYFGLGIGQSQGKIANQIWLLAENLNNVLHKEVYFRYILKGEHKDVEHPYNSGMLYVSLPKLANQATPEGELARFLLGKIRTPENEEVKAIAEVFSASFTQFKEERKVATVMTFRERYYDTYFYKGKKEGMREGKKEGVAMGEAQKQTDLFNQLAELQAQGLDPADIVHEMQRVLTPQ